MNAVITGASGLVGGNVAVALRQAGHSVKATRRASSKVDHLDGLDIGWVEASLSEPEALARAIDGADVVFHCAAAVTIRRDAPDWVWAANVTGTEHVLAAMKDAGRLVHCSTVNAVGLSTDGQPCTEESPWNFADFGMADGYTRTKRAAEERVMAAAAEGLDAVVVNPTLMIGPYDAKPSSGAIVVELVKGTSPFWTPGANNFVDVRDVAQGMLLAWERGQAGRRYILGGENMPYKDFFELVAGIAGVKAPRWRLPGLLRWMVGAGGDLQAKLLDKEPLVTSSMLDFGFCERFQFDSTRARTELGYTSGPLPPAIESALAWFRDHGML